MDVAKEPCAAPDPILNAGIKNFLESFALGRYGIRAGRAARRLAGSFRDPARRSDWKRRFVLPVRNAMCLNRPLSVSVEGITVLLEPKGAVAGDIWTGIRRQGHELSLLLKILEPGMIFLDIGADAGLFAISAAKKIGAKSILAVEPEASARKLLARNLELNGLRDINVIPDAPGPLMAESPETGGFDAFLERNQIPRVDAVRLGIQGAELDILRGATKLLERPDAPLILYEGFGLQGRRFGYHPVEVLWLLESRGYSLFKFESAPERISEITPEFRYDSAVVAVKQGHPAHSKLREIENAGMRPQPSWT